MGNEIPPADDLCNRCNRSRYVAKNQDHICTYEKVAYLKVIHSGYGCDTGCCGHKIIVCDAKGNELDNHFELCEHPNGVPKREFIETLCKEWMKERNVERPIHYDECEIVDD